MDCGKVDVAMGGTFTGSSPPPLFLTALFNSFGPRVSLMASFRSSVYFSYKKVSSQHLFAPVTTSDSRHQPLHRSCWNGRLANYANR